MAEYLWTLAGFGPVLGVGGALAFVKHRRGTGLGLEAMPSRARWNGPTGGGVADEFKAAERQLGMLLRRMRSYRAAPYDFTNSRIKDDAEFDHCLDLATALSLRIGDLTGAPAASPRERERAREQVLQSLSAGAGGSIALR